MCYYWWWWGCGGVTGVSGGGVSGSGVGVSGSGGGGGGGGGGVVQWVVCKEGETFLLLLKNSTLLAHPVSGSGLVLVCRVDGHKARIRTAS